MAQIKFVRGIKNNYVPGSTHEDAIFFATDTHELLVNGKVYGLGRAVSDIAYNEADHELNITFVGNVNAEGPDNPQNIDIVIPLAGDKAGLMSAGDKAALDELIGDGSGSVADQIQEAITQLTNTINDYSVNGKTFGDNGGAIIVNGADIQLTGYAATATSPVVVATDTVNTAIAKVEKANEDTQSALDTFVATKGVANGLASLDENGKVPASQLNGQLAHVFGVDGVCTEAELASQSPEEGDIYYTTDTKKFYNYNGSDWDEPMDPKDDTIYNFRNSDKTGNTGRTNILYRWDGKDLVEISESLALGETTGTAYDGAKGKANRDALNSIPTTVVTGFGAVTPAAGEVTIAVTDSDKASGTNVFGTGDGDTITLPAATASTAGVMTAADKTYIEEVKTALGNDASALENVLKVDNAGIGKLAGYTPATEKAAVAAGDTINVAIGKLEKTLNDLTGGEGGSIQDQIQEAINGIKGDATEAGDTLGELEDRIETAEADIDQAQADITAIKAYTVNSKAINTNPVLNGADIALTGYTTVTGGTVAATDTINGAINKLESSLVWYEA